jgi:hypothetical protein
VPESFRGGCSVGADAGRTNIGLSRITLSDNIRMAWIRVIDKTKSSATHRESMFFSAPQPPTDRPGNTQILFFENPMGASVFKKRSEARRPGNAQILFNAQRRGGRETLTGGSGWGRRLAFAALKFGQGRQQLHDCRRHLVLAGGPTLALPYSNTKRLRRPLRGWCEVQALKRCPELLRCHRPSQP